MIIKNEMHVIQLQMQKVSVSRRTVSVLMRNKQNHIN